MNGDIFSIVIAREYQLAIRNLRFIGRLNDKPVKVELITYLPALLALLSRDSYDSRNINHFFVCRHDCRYDFLS